MPHPIDRHPAFLPRRKLSPWIFKLDAPYRRQIPWTGIDFKADWLTITPDGWLEIPAGYAWDGCSFKRSVLDLFIIGTPDGIIDIRTMKPKTYFASLVHDVLYQYYGYHGISRLEVDRNFRAMLREGQFALSGLYYCAVRLLGGLGFANRGVKTTESGQEFFGFWLQERE